ncbi:MAG: DUF309 domain-containing protein [Bdellovibrionales bacterium]|nr:DUF309 domain-containing protein [Bdellovibrionales bacterium]
MKKYTTLNLPPTILLQNEKPQAWEDPTASFSIKTVPDFWFEDVVYLYAIDLFNAGFFWQAHEVWEKKWNFFKNFHPEYADWIQSLIQVGAGMYHCRLNNTQGYQSCVDKALNHAKAYQNQKILMGVHVEDWLETLEKQKDQEGVETYPLIVLQD